MLLWARSGSVFYRIRRQWLHSTNQPGKHMNLIASYTRRLGRVGRWFRSIANYVDVAQSFQHQAPLLSYIPWVDSVNAAPIGLCCIRYSLRIVRKAPSRAQIHETNQQWQARVTCRSIEQARGGKIVRGRDRSLREMPLNRRNNVRIMCCQNLSDAVSETYKNNAFY